MHASCRGGWFLVASLWCVCKDRETWSIPLTASGPGSHSSLLSHPREMPLKSESEPDFFSPSLDGDGDRKKRWPQASAGTGPGSWPALEWTQGLTLLSLVQAALGEHPELEELVTTAHHPHGCHAHVIAQKLQQRPGRRF